MVESRSRQVVIAGAGVAGLTAALAFAGRGYAVTVLEQAKQLEAAGAGIQLSPNATRILRQLGVLDRWPRSVHDRIGTTRPPQPRASSDNGTPGAGAGEIQLELPVVRA